MDTESFHVLCFKRRVINFITRLGARVLKCVVQPEEVPGLMHRRVTVAERTARSRASDEGREGMAAYLEKRKPAWTGE